MHYKLLQMLFGIVVIDGKDFIEQIDAKEEKRMIMREVLVKEEIKNIKKEYDRVEYESRRLKKRGNFVKSEENLKTVLDTPLNILKKGKWRTMQIGKEKQRVWLPSGEEILSRSGIISWEEDLKHLHNQLTVEQPGSCAELDKIQEKRDQRKLQTQLREAERKSKEEERKKRAVADALPDIEDPEEVETDDDKEIEYAASLPRSTQQKVDVMGPIAAVADRLNISCRSMAMLGAAAAKSTGLSVSQTNCSVTTAWRQRSRSRKKLLETVRGSFLSPEAVFLHWDGML